MTIRKNLVRENFTTIPNDLITDNNLSMSAKILYCYLASKPDDWDIWNKDIQNALNIKSDKSIAKYFKELIETGWITRENKRTKNGKITGGYDYTINVPNWQSLPIGKISELGQNDIHTNTNISNVNINYDYTNTDNKEIKKRKTKKKFIPPTLEEIEAFCRERKNNVDAKKFLDSYTVSNWIKSNGQPIINWKQTMIMNWEGKNYNSSSKPKNEPKPIYQNVYEWMEQEKAKEKIEGLEDW